MIIMYSNFHYFDVGTRRCEAYFYYYYMVFPHVLQNIPQKKKSQVLGPQALGPQGLRQVLGRSQVLGLGLSLGLGPGPQVASDFERVRLHWMAKILEIIFEAPHVSQKKIGHTTYTTESGKQPDFKMISKQLEKKKQIWK